MNLGGWLTTVVGRLCLDVLRSRRSRREESFDERLPDLILSHEDRIDPEQQALIADSVGLALPVVLETLTPHERLAFVLHDMFAVPFEEIASIAAARQLASRARRRVRGAAPTPDVDLNQQRKIVDAFLAAVRGGSLEALLEVLDPDVVLRSDRIPGGLKEIRCARWWPSKRLRSRGSPSLYNGCSSMRPRESFPSFRVDSG